ncbi:MAG: polyprenyl synthetase family protein [Verrucomicrobia subdivision 3 bacterium]|nr:polyprenyl synthetase family protein [Limisphaerales bacterium]
MTTASAPLKIPRVVPQRKPRTPRENIPQTREERETILREVRHYVAEQTLVPPVPMNDLKVHADELVAALGTKEIYRDYIGILINNELWRETLAAVPFERRLLMVPKCLRVEAKCPAPFDEFGLLCKSCGLCSIQDLEYEAEKLGYAALVAEGSAIVMSLIQTGKIDAIVGVACIPVLERAFPYMEAAAVPGVAIPLLQDDCIDTAVDEDWIWDYIYLTSDDQTRRLDLSGLHDEVETWFTPESLAAIMGESEGETEAIGRAWLARAGKRWRPFLSVAAYQALRDDATESVSDDLKKIAIAVECFHKASLIHDDIEDEDAERYGEKTLHEEYGLAVALNVGDLLIGEGYRLIGETKLSAEQRAAMLQVAANGQRHLCRGQGAELVWQRNPEPLKSVQVLEIFRQKTAPAFEVALRLGSIAADLGKYGEVSEVLGEYSKNLGIAYQIRDDLSDLGESGDTNDLASLRPTLLLAVAHEKAKGEQKAQLAEVWRRQLPEGVTFAQIEQWYLDLKAVKRAEDLQLTYKELAIRSLTDLENANLKGLLRRVIGKIFNDTVVKGWCSEVQEISELEKVRAQNSNGTATVSP